MSLSRLLCFCFFVLVLVSVGLALPLSVVEECLLNVYLFLSREDEEVALFFNVKTWVRKFLKFPDDDDDDDDVY